MKNLFIFLVAILSATTLFAATAPLKLPVDSSKIEIRLKAKHHAFLVVFMPDKSTASHINYMYQVANKLALDSAGNIKDPNQEILVTVSVDLVPYLFLSVGSQQERLTTNYNNEIKELLLPQLQTRPALLQQIMEQAMRNWAETDQLIEHGFQYLKNIKL